MLNLFGPPQKEGTGMKTSGQKFYEEKIFLSLFKLSCSGPQRWWLYLLKKFNKVEILLIFCLQIFVVANLLLQKKGSPSKTSPMFLSKFRCLSTDSNYLQTA